MTPVYFLSLLTVVYGGLIIDIDVRTDPPFIDVRNFISTNVISDVERATFGIQDAKLKKAVAKYTNDNTVPDFVYVKKSGGKNDLYTNYFAEPIREINRIVKPNYVDAKINKCEPKSNTTPSTSIKTEWKLNGKLAIADNITHIVYFDSGEIKRVYAWGQGVDDPITISSDHVKCMTVTIKYEITIAGDVAADYTKPRKSPKGNDHHHYYAYDLVKVQEAAGLPKSVICYETITVVYPKKKEMPVSSNTLKPSSTVKKY